MKSICPRAVGVSLACLFTLSAASAHAAVPTYYVRDLGEGFSPTAINQAGDILGYASGVGSVLVRNGVTENLGINGVGRAINDVGQVAGATIAAAPSHAFLYESGTQKELGGVNFVDSDAYGINRLGQVVGAVGSTSSWEDNRRGFLYSGGTITDIGSFGGATVAMDINDLGMITGSSAYEASYGSAPHAFVSKQGVMTDLGVLPGGLFSSGVAINNAGQVAGSSSYGDPAAPYPEPYPIAAQHAFLYSGAGLVDLGTFGGDSSYSRGINSAGQVVGAALNASGESRAFIYSDGALIDLNSQLASASGWVIGSAYRINDQGVIIGIGQNGSGSTHGIALIPVPEPESVALGCAGLLVTAGYLRRRRALKVHS